ncbi:MAG: UDP-2,4-diacetamido-2,4,6-trideoxy-beta-L-altropyranose hydrolase [Myxococcota bacterium]|jgi:UDP-2,4-diacetamido-2,4,6-trideoxy-beta-L-altropyranose hydrolase|nr:UDP-2,4-diacetamido-2,4,6-trideoxy-beta-L-altropyranose hydrolase [Myxococcota bacterium]
MPKTLLIRADAGPDIGMGHVMRCLALALEWKRRGGALALLSASPPDAVVNKWRSIGADVFPLEIIRGTEEDLLVTAELIGQLAPDWLVVDGYHFDSTYQRTLANLGQLLWIDDEAHAAPYTADLVLNQNLHAHESMYAERRGETSLLLGLRYVLIRPEFLGRRWSPNTPSDCPKVVIIMGGSDPSNVSLAVAQAISALPVRIDIHIVVGPASPHLSSLQHQSQRATQPWTLHHAPHDLPGLLCSADCVVTAAGSTSWELACLGVPTCLLTVATNQLPIAAELGKQQAAVLLGSATDVSSSQFNQILSDLLQDEALRKQLSNNGRNLVDGRGSMRVCDQLCSFDRP